MIRTTPPAGAALRALLRWLLRALVVVLLLAAALAAVLYFTLPKPEAAARAERARFDVRRIATDGVEAFRQLHGRYPTNDEGLATLIREKLLKANAPDGTLRDPWGLVYVYERPGRIHPDGFDVGTYGADGKPGGEGADADIWNE